MTRIEMHFICDRYIHQSSCLYFHLNHWYSQQSMILLREQIFQSSGHTGFGGYLFAAFNERRRLRIRKKNRANDWSDIYWWAHFTMTNESWEQMDANKTQKNGYDSIIDKLSRTFAYKFSYTSIIDVTMYVRSNLMRFTYPITNWMKNISMRLWWRRSSALI